MWRILGLFWCFQDMHGSVGWGMDMVRNAHLLTDVKRTILHLDISHWAVPSCVQVRVRGVCRYRPLPIIRPRVYNQRKVKFLFAIFYKLENSRGKQILWTWNSPTKSAYFLLPPLLPPFFFFFFIAIGFLLVGMVAPKSALPVITDSTISIFTCLWFP